MQHVIAALCSAAALAGRPALVPAAAPRPVARVALGRARPLASAAVAAADLLAAAPHALELAGASSASASSEALAFADQGQNLAGIFFQASLLPYLAFLAFLNYDKNGTPPLVKFGFQFLLLFVLATIPTGIVSKSVYGVSLADADWLHGGAELLLTVTNLILVAGLRAANVGDVKPNPLVRNGALALFALLVGVGAAGIPVLGLQAHDPFLLGVGALPESALAASPLALHAEPANALSIPTWAIHSSSVIEWLVAMSAMWTWAEVSGNEKWKGFVWAMLPLHASGVAACTYHFFYNAPELKYLVTLQAGLTLAGNTALAIAAGRVAFSNGWKLSALNPLGGGGSEGAAEAEGGAALELRPAAQPSLTAEAILAAEVLLLSGAAAYFVKYGELALDLPFSPSVPASALVFALPPVAVAAQYAKRSGLLGGADGAAGEQGGMSLSMADVKKYGVSGTVAYVLTELAFWAVAFPVAATVFYNTAGHWPDFGENADRAAVLGFIFAGANAARLAVPLRLGAAIALAPWVDENIMARFKSDEASE